MIVEVSELAALQCSFEQFQNGDPAALESLVDHSYRKLQRMASRMIRGYPAVRRWEDTDDVCQTAVVRLQRALGQTKPESLRHYFRLAGAQIRRTLIELARKHKGPLGLSTNQDTHDGNVVMPDPTNDPFNLADWADFHQQIEQLPDILREAFDLLWYGGLSQAEAAEQLGVTVRTVKRRWREARLLLARNYSGYGLR